MWYDAFSNHRHHGCYHKHHQPSPPALITSPHHQPLATPCLLGFCEMRSIPLARQRRACGGNGLFLPFSLCHNRRRYHATSYTTAAPPHFMKIWHSEVIKRFCFITSAAVAPHFIVTLSSSNASVARIVCHSAPEWPERSNLKRLPSCCCLLLLADMLRK